MKKAAGKTGQGMAKGLMGKLGGLAKPMSMTIEDEGTGFMDNMDLEEANDDDVIANVERMLKGDAE